MTKFTVKEREEGLALSLAMPHARERKSTFAATFVTSNTKRDQPRRIIWLSINHTEGYPRQRDDDRSMPTQPSTDPL